ncbi:hypothetical protein [Aureimonas glaciei]|uniref:Uncharacterized protein n=1 Tax=Aureimonas glaciei TaxID=1776957 RepID=A0A916XTT9_9HYPH|nr:hypothetical protein [Aureimonas glaciei]GGD09033.1 hypothetical protein GCM10011335_09850 [Aureimonas glaciei]
MKSIFVGLVLTLCIGVVAALVLTEAQRPSYAAFSSTSGARVGNPGDNLVGADWSQPGEGAAGG